MSTETKGAPIVVRQLSHAEQVADRCVHFNGISEGTCEAGIAYASVALDHAPVEYRREHGTATYTRSRSFPCLDSLNMGCATCSKREAPTPEAVAAKVAAADRDVADMLAAMTAIQRDTNGQRGVRGSVECPRCKQSLRYSVAGNNGHIHAVCETKGCLAWMQ